MFPGSDRNVKAASPVGRFGVLGLLGEAQLDAHLTKPRGFHTQPKVNVVVIHYRQIRELDLEAFVRAPHRFLVNIRFFPNDGDVCRISRRSSIEVFRNQRARVARDFRVHLYDETRTFRSYAVTECTR